MRALNHQDPFVESLRTALTILLLLIILLICTGSHAQTDTRNGKDGYGSKVDLPAPNETKSATNFSHVIGWEHNETPLAPRGFTVTRYADGFDNPRWMYVAPNGDVLVAESNTNHPLLERIGGYMIGAGKSNHLGRSADRITLLRDLDNDGVVDEHETFIENLNQPFGMLIIDNWFYVANTDAIWRFPYKTGQRALDNLAGEKIADLPAGKHNQHWTRNIIASKDNKKIYVAIGSGTNIADHGLDEEVLKADILVMNPDGSEMKVYASGLRNPVGMAYAPGTNTLWTVVNERDGLGDDLVPDYLTSVKENGFYGWPYTYFGDHPDPRVTQHRPESVKETIVPEVALGSHTASLGLAFIDNPSFPTKYRSGALIAQHGSWNRSVLSGYRVVFVPFKNGKPSGEPEDFLTGFIANLEKGKVHGRPVGVAVLNDGSILVTDDVSNAIWRVSPGGMAVSSTGK